MITTLPGLRQKPGWAGLPYIGVRLRITNKHLYIVAPWPGMWRELHLPYNTGDIAQKDKDGYIRILGRSDDVIQVSGHRIGTAELESVIVECPGVVEAAVVSIPEEVHGEQIIAFVRTSSAVSEGAVQDYVRREYGTFAVPSTVNIVDTLPKTRSGKIMRRMLRARALGTEAGDLSTLEE